MTTPNEELILKLRGQAYTTCRPDQLCDQAADLLQSLAERIKELEEEIGGWREDQKENIGVAFALQREVNKITSERDELREKYTDTYCGVNYYTESQLKQAVRDALDALKDVAQTLAWMQHGKCRGFSDGLLTTDEALDKARTALSKYKGAK